MNRKVRKLNIFISYSHINMRYKDKLLTSLGALKQSYNIEPWHDGKINAGNIIDDDVKEALKKSEIILLIVTDDFLNSYYCMKKELGEAMERQRRGESIVVPVMYQEAVLDETLSFFGNNRVPEDGKAISTGFKNQSQGCTRAVNMIKKMIDDYFPNCKIGQRTSQGKKGPKCIDSKVKTNEQIPLYIELYKDGHNQHIALTQSMLDLIPAYFDSIGSFRKIMEQSLFDAKKRYAQLYKKYKGTEIPNEERLGQLRLFLMDICAYTKMYITEHRGIKVHFRVSQNNYYLGLIASTEDNDRNDLATDWTTQMTPIRMYEGLIYHSSRLHAPLIKSLNPQLNARGRNDRIWKDYVTFTFPKFHAGQTPLISYCISVHRDCYKIKGDMLKILAYLNLGNIVETYISDYCDICCKIDKSYSLESVINSL